MLKSAGHNVDIVEYLKNPLKEEELTVLLQKLNIKPEELIRRNEALYKKNFRDKNFTEKEWIKILKENPVLIERPIVVKGHKAIVCRPPERIYDFIK